MEQVKAFEKADLIGLSNHQHPRIEEILKVTTTVPTLNQLELRSYLQRAHNYLTWMRRRGIKTASFNRLTPIAKARPGSLDESLARIHSDVRFLAMRCWLVGGLLRNWLRRQQR